MNYYERYCGDYARDTGHLSLQEHGAYTVMLDTYYATETPLPADYVALYRICRAMSGKERDAVRKVADEFFPVSGDGLRHNRRADEEIDEARPRIEAARANGTKGGRPRKKPIGLQQENPLGLEQEPAGKAPHTPTPTPKVKSKALSADADHDFLKFWKIYPNKAARQKAWKAFQSLSPDADLQVVLLAAVEAQKKTDKWLKEKGEFIPHAATWLNGKRWEDEVVVAISAREEVI